MSQGLRVGIAGGGAAGRAHAQGYATAGGWKLVAVADLIPDRAKVIADQYKLPKIYDDAMKLIEDREIDVVSICLPTPLHVDIAIAAFKIGKHVLLEMPPGPTTKAAKILEKASEKAGRQLMYACPRRFGAAEQSARQAIEKGYAGDIYHARASWLRTRGVPRGTGWYADPEQSGGGAMIDLGLHLFDLVWHLLGQPKPVSVFAVTHNRLSSIKVEEFVSAMIRFENDTTLELTSSWALNQPPTQAGTICRLFGQQGALDVYTPAGPMLYRSFDDKGASKSTALKQPKLAGHAAMVRHFRECIQNKSTPITGPSCGILLMELTDAIYQSASSGKSVHV